MLRQLISRFVGDISGEMLRSTAKAVAITGVFSFGAAYYLSERLDKDRVGLEQLVFNTLQDRSAQRLAQSRPGVDMTTTGSIRGQSVKLDPCEIPGKR